MREGLQGRIVCLHMLLRDWFLLGLLLLLLLVWLIWLSAKVNDIIGGIKRSCILEHLRRGMYCIAIQSDSIQLWTYRIKLLRLQCAFIISSIRRRNWLKILICSWLSVIKITSALSILVGISSICCDRQHSCLECTIAVFRISQIQWFIIAWIILI